MEELPHRSPDEEPHGPEPEQFHPAEIDMTGVMRQDDALRDVISDAIVEAEASDGQFPEWGARTLARALANRLDNPFDGALHHYAITGHFNPDHIAHELAIIALRVDADDNETLEWINRLGNHALNAPTESVPGENATGNDASTAPDLRESPEAFGRHLRQVFAEADARSEPIAQTDARSLAMLFSIFLDPDSQMARFADTGDANPAELYAECQEVRRRTEYTPGADSWITHFEQHLASRSDLGRQLEPLEPTDADRITEQVIGEDRAAEALEVPVFGTPLEQVTAYLRIAFAQADARGEPISNDDAQTIATLLATLLGSDSEMARFAESGEGDVHSLRLECRRLTSRDWSAADIKAWAERFVQYLSSSPAATAQPEPSLAPETSAESDDPQVTQGISSYGDAFRAYLQLPDVDAEHDDVLHGFHEAYLGSAESMPQLLAVIRDEMAEAAQATDLDLSTMDDASLERSARMTYDIVEINGRLYLFSK